MKYLHTMLRVKDIEKSLEFYEGLLGLKLDHTMDLEDCRLYFLSDNQGYTQIELTANFDTPENGYTEGTKFGHLAFEIEEDYETFTPKLKALGHDYLYEPYFMGDMKIAFIKDPDGNQIELIKYESM